MSIDWKAEYLKSVESGCITLDELREARAELDATNRQVEILSDALAESRREVAAIKQARSAQQEHEPENEPFVSLASVQSPVATNKIYVTREQLAELYPPHAAQRQWVGLTVLEQADCFANTEDATEFYHAIEAKLKEKNT